MVGSSDKQVTLRVNRNALMPDSHSIYNPGSFIEPTFVLDYDQDPIQQILKDVDPSTSSFSPLLSVVSLVDSWIPIKNRKRAFDIASKVADTGEGDCTEHSVLLGAVSRALGHPAKVVIGIVIIGLEDAPAAFGHAWNEIYVDGHWQLADAALHNIDHPVFYIPTGTLDNEGPGFSLSLFNAVSKFPQQIVIK